MKFFSENAWSIKKKVIISHNQHQKLVLITSQWQVLSKIKLGLSCPGANTRDKTWRLKGKEMCHENCDPTASNAAGKTEHTDLSSENGTTQRWQKAWQNPTAKGSHKKGRTLFLPNHLKPCHFSECSWTKSVHHKAQAAVWKVEEWQIWGLLGSGFQRVTTLKVKGSHSQFGALGVLRDKILSTHHLPCSGSRCQRRGHRLE